MKPNDKCIAMIRNTRPLVVHTYDKFTWSFVRFDMPHVHHETWLMFTLQHVNIVSCDHSNFS